MADTFHSMVQGTTLVVDRLLHVQLRIVYASNAVMYKTGRQYSARTIVAAYKGIAIAALQYAIHMFSRLLHGNVHVAIQARECTWVCQLAPRP